MKDLLDPLSSMRIAIRETPSGEMYLSGVREEQVTSAKEVMRLVEKGSMARTTGSTRMNQSSSRSHAIFTIMLEHSIHCSTPSENGSAKSDNTILGHTGAAVLPSGLNRDGPEVRRCKFHFVDLAGSERAKRTGAQGVRMKEGIDINKGLLVLGNVISALGGENKRAHVPYRDSKLTRLLQDSLGGNSKTVMLCCVSPADADFNESLNAVRYANRARNIQNKPVVNIDPTSLLIIELRKKVQVFHVIHS
jgi:kinesin family protein 4/21/27